MNSDIELDVQSKQTLPLGTSSEQILDKKTSDQDVDVPVDLDGTPRSNFRMFAILTALFVCEISTIARRKAKYPQLSLFVAALDATIVSTAAPTMSHDLNSAAGYTWIGGAFLLGNAVSGPIWAKLSDIFGRKLIILLALAVFFASSAVCATAKTMEALIIGRAIQGAAGGGLILLVHVCIADMFSLRQRSLLMGLTEGIWALAGGIGPILGGVFASLVNWRWCCKSELFGEISHVHSDNRSLDQPTHQRPGRYLNLDLPRRQARTHFLR